MLFSFTKYTKISALQTRTLYILYWGEGGEGFSVFSLFLVGFLFLLINNPMLSGLHWDLRDSTGIHYSQSFDRCRSPRIEYYISSKCFVHSTISLRVRSCPWVMSWTCIESKRRAWVSRLPRSVHYHQELESVNWMPYCVFSFLYFFLVNNFFIINFNI